MKKFNLYLISDSTGETVVNVGRAAAAQFEAIEPKEHLWVMIRTKRQMGKVLKAIEKNPGIVMYTIADPLLAKELKDGCISLNAPCVPVLYQAISDLSNFLKLEATSQIGKQHELDSNYFTRIEALNFAITHDDGQAANNLEKADIVLVGASRTSKSPTSVYLAYRGYRAANVPFVPGCLMPENITKLKKPLIVGLTIMGERLVEIRRNRITGIGENKDTSYTNLELVNNELLLAKKYFLENNWPIIDVTRRSVEETAATIIQYFLAKNNNDL